MAVSSVIVFTPSTVSVARKESSALFIAFLTSPPQATEIVLTVLSSISTEIPFSSAKIENALLTAFSTSSYGTGLNSKTVLRLKIALYT